MSTQHFDATKELETIRQRKRVVRQQVYHRSQLEKFRAELVALRQSGGSFRELAEWLKSKKRTKVSHTTVRDYLNKLPELKNNEVADAKLSQCQETS